MISTIKNKVKDLLINLNYCSKPNFIIIGAQKAGTSALFNILKTHSLIVGSSKKEIHYFDNDDWYSKKNIGDYHSFFPLPYKTSKDSQFFEATPIYLYHPDVAKRLFAYNPKIKLIAILRNPAERALSAWTMYHHHFKTGKHQHLLDPRSFKQAIEEEFLTIDATSFYTNKIAYVKRGIYHYQIKEYYNFFNEENLLIINYSDLKLHLDSTLRKIFDFLELPYEKLERKIVNKSQINIASQFQNEIQFLKDFYLEHNNILFSMLGKNFGWNEKK